MCYGIVALMAVAVTDIYYYNPEFYLPLGLAFTAGTLDVAVAKEELE